LRNTQAFFATCSDGVVKADALDEAAITANTFVGDNDVEKWTGFCAAGWSSRVSHR